MVVKKDVLLRRANIKKVQYKDKQIKTPRKVLQINSEYNQAYHTSPSCYYVLDLLCVSITSNYNKIILNNF